MYFEVAQQPSFNDSHLAGVFPGPSSVRQHRELFVHPRGGSQRPEVEEFVRREFFAHFHARVTRFMPLLVALHDRTGVRAVVGCRSAADESLFLEKYTREPIESLLARRLGVRVSRDEVVEIGSLACRGPRAAVEMVRALVPFLLDAGFSWVVFTGADTVKRVFAHLKLEPTVLCAADEVSLGSERDDWGDYYRHDPEVMAGRLRDGAVSLGASGGPPQ